MELGVGLVRVGKIQSTENPPTKIVTWTTTLTTPFHQSYLLSTPSFTELNTYVLHLNFLQKEWITFTKSYKRTTTQHSSFNKANSNRKPNSPMGKFIERARVVIPYIKGLSEQYRHTLAKYKVRVFFKGTSTIKSLVVHPKDPLPDAQKTNIIYHWKCPAHNCPAEYIGEPNRSLRKRISDHRNQTTSAIKNHHISTKHPKTRTRRFHNIDKDSNTPHHWAKEAVQFISRIHHSTEALTKSESLHYLKLIKPHT